MNAMILAVSLYFGLGQAAVGGAAGDGVLRALFETVRASKDPAPIASEIEELGRAAWVGRIPFPVHVPTALERVTLLRWRDLDFDPLPNLQRLEIPMLFLLGDADRRMDATTSARRLTDALGERRDVDLRLIAGADHELFRVPDAPEQVADWFVARLMPDAR